MVLGDYHPSTHDGEDEDIERMKFIERSIRLELDYIRRLRKSLKEPDDVLGNINIIDTTPKKKTSINNVAEVVIDAISEATWPSIATSSTNSATTKAYYDMSTRLNTTTNPNNPDEVYDFLFNREVPLWKIEQKPSFNTIHFIDKRQGYYSHHQ